MLDKRFLQSFLKVNNASEQMSDSEVHTVLSKAGWTESETEAAIALLRSGASGAALLAPKGTGSGITFRPDMEFSSGQLSNLLGVDIELDPHSMDRAYYVRSSGGGATFRDTATQVLGGVAIVTLSFGMAIAIGFVFLYFFEIGPFQR